MTMTVFLVCVVSAMILGNGLAQPSNVHYAIIAAKAFRPSSVYNVSATVYNVNQDVQLDLRLQSSDNSLFIQKVIVLKNGVTEIVSLVVPDNVPPASYYLLMASGTGGYSFSTSEVVSVRRKTLSLFVQTDKVMYKPGQTVLFRAIALHPDLKPYQRHLDIAVYDPDNNRIMQWLRQQNDSGVVTQSLPLSEQTRLGAWKIIVTAEENTYTKTFEVAEYVLSKFEVIVTLPSYFLVNLNRRDLQSDLKITVTAKYTFGQPVKGRAIVMIQLKPFSDLDHTNYTKILKNVMLVDGKGDVALTINDLLSLAPSDPYNTDYRSSLSSRSILVVADVNETLTGTVLSGNATVSCASQKYSLTFLDFSPNNFKPGLPYTAYPSFYVNVTNSTVYGYKSINAFMSTNSQSIQVVYDSLDGVITAPEDVRFNVTTTTPISAFQYEILSKGNILLSDNVVGNTASNEHSFSVWVSKELAIELAPSARVVVWVLTDSGEVIADSRQVPVSNVFANEVSLSFDQESTTPSENVSLTVNASQGSYVAILAVDQSALLMKTGNDISTDMVSEELTEYDTLSMNSKRRKRTSPRSYDDAYYWYPWYYWPIVVDGTDSRELISNAGLLFLTDGSFYTKPPIGAYPPCRPYGPSAPSGPARPPGAIGATGPSGQIGPVGGIPYCPEGPGMPGLPGAVGPQGPVGATGPPRVPNGGAPATRPMPTQAIPPVVTNSVDDTQPRIEFPETWLWTEAIAGPDGQVRLNTTCPDTITSWVASAFAISQVTGLGVAEKTKLTVFKQFFLSPDLPYSVIRGEEFALKVNVFNYVSTRLDVLVSLRQSSYYKVQGSASKLATVESNDAASVYFWIVPGSMGQIPIDISAQSPVAGDAVRVMLLVKPEGVLQQYSTALFIQLSDSVPTYNNSLNISVPPFGTLVQGSEYIEVTVFGDLLGPSIKGLDNLLGMPYGCGEQNMIKFAPDVYVVKYLSITGQLTETIKRTALDFLISGYQNQLFYQRSDGSYSAFGERDKCGSLWLSSFTIKCFHQAKDYIPVDDAKIAQTMRWIVDKQASDGSFAEPPLCVVHNTALQGGSAVGASMTAYVLISLIENQNNAQMDSANVNTRIVLAQQYLEDQVSGAISDTYALCIISYALALARSSKVGHVLQLLEGLAKVEADTRHWEKTSAGSDDYSQSGWRPLYTQARAIDIEMTSYVLLTYCHLKNITMGLSIAKWIVAQRNANGGFSSTQDTVIALQALSEIAYLTYGPSNERSLQVSIATDSEDHTFLPITDETSILLQSYELSSQTRRVFLSANGKGAALVQLNVKYNVYETGDVPGINFNINTTQNGNSITIKSCTSWNKTVASGMAVIEFYHLTGHKASNVDANKPIKLIENDDEKVVLYFDELTSNETCVEVTAVKVFPVVNVKNAPAKVYSYYDPSAGRTLFYAAPQTMNQNSVCDECKECCTVTSRATPPPPTRSSSTTTQVDPIAGLNRRTTPTPKRSTPQRRPTPPLP